MSTMSTSRGVLPLCQTRCTNESSNAIARPARQRRVSPPTSIPSSCSSPSAGSESGRWIRSRGGQCQGRASSGGERTRCGARCRQCRTPPPLPSRGHRTGAAAPPVPAGARPPSHPRQAGSRAAPQAPAPTARPVGRPQPPRPHPPPHPRCMSLRRSAAGSRASRAPQPPPRNHAEGPRHSRAPVRSAQSPRDPSLQAPQPASRGRTQPPVENIRQICQNLAKSPSNLPKYP